MLRRHFLKAVGAAVVAAQVGLHQFASEDRELGRFLDEINQVLIEKVLPQIADNMFKASPLLTYIKRSS